AQQRHHALVHLPQLGQAHASLGRRGLVGGPDDRHAEPLEHAQALDGALLEHHVVRVVGRLVDPELLVHHALVDDAVAVQEHRGGHDTDSHLAGATASAGCETSRCHTTACQASVWGVRRSAGAGTTTTASASAAVTPSGLPTTPHTNAPTDRASSTARTTLTEI